MRYILAMEKRHRDELESLLLPGDHKEHAAYVVCGVARIPRDPWSGSGVRRLSVRDVIPITSLTSNSETHVSWSTDSLAAVAGRCEREGLALFIAHNHPSGFDTFSPQDDDSETGVFPYVLDKLGAGAVAGSLLLLSDRRLIGRVWLDEPLRQDSLSSVMTIGETWQYERRSMRAVRASLQRQALALGEAFNSLMGDLRVGIVGCGATGSATAMMLARLGVGRLVLLDEDIVDATNLNRLHGATQSDADAGRNKTAVLQNAIAALGLGCQVRTLDAFVESEAARAALRSCDVIFSCTDDHLGRSVLSRLAYYYLLPIIDVGVVLNPLDKALGFKNALARVTVVQPGTTCLSCQGILSGERIRADSIRRANPEEFERLKAEGYIVGGGDPSPAVITFTTEAASMGITEFIQRFTQFRGANGSATQRYRDFLGAEDFRASRPSRPGCGICARVDSWGRADCDPFLGMVL